MSIFAKLYSFWAPPRLRDPAFGDLVFIRIPEHPERSYWECEWSFPVTGTDIAIAIPGTEKGLDPIAREFFLALPERFQFFITQCLSPLQEVWLMWFERDLPSDLFSVLSLAGIGITSLGGSAVEWEVSFETTGEKWLGITVPFIGDQPQPATVET